MGKQYSSKQAQFEEKELSQIINIDSFKYYLSQVYGLNSEQMENMFSIMYKNAQYEYKIVNDFIAISLNKNNWKEYENNSYKK